MHPFQESVSNPAGPRADELAVVWRVSETLLIEIGGHLCLGRGSGSPSCNGGMC